MVRIDSNPFAFFNEFINLSQKLNLVNLSCNDSKNGSCMDVSTSSETGSEKVFWALLLIPLPLVAVVGNILVILSVYKEKSLQTVTNYFIVSLACADLLVAAVVMPFAVYVLVNVDWELSDTLCDFYIAVDVTCSSASIFNLVAISVDRYIAVTQPIKYSKHRNNKRVFLSIAIVWILAAAIGSPIVLGLNTSPERDPQLCVFYNSDFIIFSSLFSFYIPCIAMVCLYYRIFKAIHERAKKNKERATGGNRPSPSISTGKSKCTQKNSSASSSSQHKVIMQTGTITTQTSTNLPEDELEDEDDDELTIVADGEDPLATKGSTPVVVKLTTRCSNTDSGYDGPSQQETQFTINPKVDIPSHKSSPDDSPKSNNIEMSPKPRKNGILVKTSSRGKGRIDKIVVERKKRSRFNLGRRHKSSSKKREKASVKRERKATKTLAIVLAMFLICWVPFFTANILDAICIKLESHTWRPGMSVFLLTTWLGYINSCVNPVIYTIFNLEFRKAFKKLLQPFCTSCSSPLR